MRYAILPFLEKKANIKVLKYRANELLIHGICGYMPLETSWHIMGNLSGSGGKE
jgi:hypothetical protein